VCRKNCYFKSFIRVCLQKCIQHTQLEMCHIGRSLSEYNPKHPTDDNQWRIQGLEVTQGAREIEGSPQAGYRGEHRWVYRQSPQTPDVHTESSVVKFFLLADGSRKKTSVKFTALDTHKSAKQKASVFTSHENMLAARTAALICRWDAMHGRPVIRHLAGGARLPLKRGRSFKVR